MTAKKRKVVTGPIQTVKPVTQVEPVIPDVDPQVKPVADTPKDEVDESVYQTVDDKPIDKESMDYKPYNSANTPQHKIPIKYKVWFFAVLIVACIFGYYLSMQPTSIPVSIVPLTVTAGADDSSVIVDAKDLEHVQIDVFKDGVEVRPRAIPTSTGWVYPDMAPGDYIFHSIEVQHSNVKYGLATITVGETVNYTDITDAVRQMVAKLPDEGNKKEICELLAGSFIESAEAKGSIEQIAKELRERNAAVLGFSGKPKLKDESVWYDLLKENGTLFNYIKSQGIVIDGSNYKQIFLAIAKGFKEST